MATTIDGERLPGGELLTLNGATARVGLTRSTMDTHAMGGSSRRNPFPAPVAIIGNVRLWRAVDIDRWAANRRPLNRRTP
jgi:predicted DNA-binding transcriptional regulator AlpA